MSLILNKMRKGKVMNPRLEKISLRMDNLIQEADEIMKTKIRGDYADYIGDVTLLHSWLIKVENIIAITFGKESIQYDGIKKMNVGACGPENVQELKGFLVGCKDDFDNGFTVGQEYKIAGEVFDNLLEESKYLLKNKHIDASAVLGRVVLEDALKRIAKNSNIDITGMKASIINNEIKKKGIYNQPQWRLNQAWLDYGNAAAHGSFDTYTEEDIRGMLNGIEQFLATSIFG